MMIIPFLLLDAIQGIDQKMGISCFVFTKIISLRQAALLVLLIASNLLAGYIYNQNFNNWANLTQNKPIEASKFILATSVLSAVTVSLAYELMGLWEILDTKSCT
jgi:hypothetical protein